MVLVYRVVKIEIVSVVLTVVVSLHIILIKLLYQIRVIIGVSVVVMNLRLTLNQR